MTDSQKQASNPLKIRLEDIKLATNNFAKDNLIGEGGFGRVYKGQLKSSSGEAYTNVAVKMLDEDSYIISGQGLHEFGTEILMLASYKHKNIVSLVGFCDEEGKKALIYKHEVHGSLDRHLANMDLTWEQRLQICLGVVCGLEYLHGSEGAVGHRVIHRDIKSSNILLDANWEAKISDFGLAKLGLIGQEISVIYTNIVGTVGYTDLHYYKTGELTKESDVFSFGVVMFEVLSGRLAIVTKYQDERIWLHSYARHCYEAGKLDKIIIPGLLKHMNSLSLKRFSNIAFQCLNDDRKKRPTMTHVVQGLKGALELQIGQVGQTELWGSSRGGDPWSYLFINNRKLRKIIIRHGEYCIHSITFIVEDINGS